MAPIPTRNDAAPGQEDEICPVCKSSRYLNPSMRFLINPTCYHKMCESCVDRIFSTGPAPCPVAGCARTLRKARFRKQTFADLAIEREVDIRRRVAGVFNRREGEFVDLRGFNNYLEEVETLTFNLLHGVDLEVTEAKLRDYANQNAPTIAHNTSLERQESESNQASMEAQKENARLAREAARREEVEERQEREEGRREVVERIAHSSENPDKVARDAQKVVLKKSTARRTTAEKSHQHSTISKTVDNGTMPTLLFQIEGLKPTVQPEPEREYDPFGGFQVGREYYTLKAAYEHPWLDNARKDEKITAGGYDIGEYCARAMMEAFSGLGVFIGEEFAESGVGGSGTATATAAVAAEGGEGVGGDVL